MNKLSKRQLIAADDAAFTVIQDIRDTRDFCVEVSYGTGSGSAVAIQGSISYNPEDGSGSWFTIDNASLSDAGGIFARNISQAHYPWMRVVLTGDAQDVKVWYSADDILQRGN